MAPPLKSVASHSVFDSQTLSETCDDMYLLLHRVSIAQYMHTRHTRHMHAWTVIECKTRLLLLLLLHLCHSLIVLALVYDVRLTLSG